MRKSSSLFFYFDVQIYKIFRNAKRFVTFFSKFFASCHRARQQWFVDHRVGRDPNHATPQRTGVEKGAVII